MPEGADWLMIALAGVLAGAMNAVAGGGSFVSLPALMAAGLPAVAANATSTVAVFPGGVASAWLYRHSLSPVGRASLRAMTAVTVAGAGLGAFLLLRLPGATFDAALPWLLLCATLALAGGPALSRWLVRRRLGVSVPVLLVLQFALGVYAGYFGGAVGIMMMATYSLLEDVDLGRIQAARTMLVTAGNLVAVTIFTVAGAVYWPQALVLGGGAVLGGVAGARFARRLPSSALRTVTVLLCAIVTVLFFLRAARM